MRTARTAALALALGLAFGASPASAFFLLDQLHAQKPVKQQHHPLLDDMHRALGEAFQRTTVVHLMVRDFHDAFAQHFDKHQ